MSIWVDHDVLDKVVDILAQAGSGEGHHLGHPYLSGYQLAIEMDRRWPQLREALGDVPIGGLGVGSRTSLAQYLAGELSRRIGTGEVESVEGAFLSDQHLEALVYTDNTGRSITSSLTGSGYLLSVYRLRAR